MGLIIDNFAGGGGASLGIEQAIGRSVDIAINHDPEAIAMHKVNHPNTKHYCQNIHQIDPIEACSIDGELQQVDLAWFSPDCKHFSKAKGGKPVEKGIRDLAWVVTNWAEQLGSCKPSVIMLENVEEFRKWGPLDKFNMPDKAREGETFDLWCAKLRELGYKVEFKTLRACDYGAPTIRKRLFLIARCDGRPIIWPAATHAAVDKLDLFSHGLKPYKVAADIVDFSIPCPSIFERKRPLAEATCKRIATGIQEHILDEPEPFIVPICNTNWAAGRFHKLSDPMKTITTAKGGEFALVTPSLVTRGYGEREGQKPRTSSIEQPLGTIVGDGAKQNLVSATLVGAGGGEYAGRPRSAKKPLKTVTSSNRQALITAFMAQHNGGPRNEGSKGRSIEAPVSTLVSRGTQTQLVTSNMITLRNNGRAEPITKPLGTLTAGGTHFAEMRTELNSGAESEEEQLDQWLGARAVAAFLMKYYGQGGTKQHIDQPMGTVRTKECFAIVTVTIAGQEFMLTDIGMRMLSPTELYRAQGFSDDYIFDCEGPNGKPLTKTAQVRMCGNSVSPVHPKSLVEANLPELCPEKREVA